MRRRLIARANIHKGDYLRALVTDTMPGDIPIVISNDGFYQNMRSMPFANADQQDFLISLLKSPRPYTMPYRYNIMRPGSSPRRLSLMHPCGQLGVVELYRTYADLICYHCRKSDASIRSPKKVGSLYFVRGSESEKNSLRRSGIDTVDLETTVSNPASYFSYSGVDRAFKFFISPDYLRLEKRYAVMHFADISKCFNSIYTHTLFWAIADVKTAKENTTAITFSNVFDRLMQSVNYNETNGICVGAEVSRIFAELILSEVDRLIVERLEKAGLRFRVHYEFRRYVDDFYVFSQNDKISEQVLSSIQLSLSEFNLHLNELKTQRVPRPFITEKSRMIREASRTLDEFFSKFIVTNKQNGISYSYPLPVRRPQALLRTLLDSIKASCFDNKSGYDAVSNYVIGALGSRVTALIDGYELACAMPDVTSDDYVSAIMLLLEAMYFFYNVDPTVPSSLRVAQGAILSFNFFKERIAYSAPFLAEQIVRWTFQFIKELSGNTIHQENLCVPLEALNVLLVLGEVGRGEILAQRAITDFCGEVDALGYFEIVSYLFCLKDDPVFNALREQLFKRTCALLKGKDKVRVDAHAAHLALDILSCPYISRTKRATLLNTLRADMDLPKLPHARAAIVVDAFENSPWFVNWRQAKLLTMIRKKELSAVY